MKTHDKHTMMGNPVTLSGQALEVGDPAPDFTVLNNNLEPVSLKDTQGVRIISVVPSLDTEVCQQQTIRFNEEAEKLNDVEVLTISMDLPFAQGRFDETYTIGNSKLLSDHKDTDFGKNYGFLMEELRLLNRGVVVIDKDNVIQHIEYVEENTNHPDYDKALAAAKALL